MARHPGRSYVFCQADGGAVGGGVLSSSAACLFSYESLCSPSHQLSEGNSGDVGYDLALL